MRKNNSSLLIHMSYFMFDIHHDRIWGVSLKPSDQILSPVDWGWKYFQGKKIAVDGCRAYDVNNFVCVCVCVFIFFHREGFFRLQDVRDIPEGMDQRSCVVNISWQRYAKFHHRHIWKCHISPPKTKTPAALLLERKRYDIIRSAKRWYILI